MSEKQEAWTVAQARAQLDELIERALKQGPQTVMRAGDEAVVVVSAEEWRRRAQRQETLAEFFANSPLRGSNLEIERAMDGPREPTVFG